MANERIPTIEERLDTLIDVGIRDAKDQPGVPAITLVPRLNGNLMRAIFQRQQAEYSCDSITQAEVVGAYLASEFSRRGKANLTPKVQVFVDQRTSEHGLYVFINYHT